MEIMAKYHASCTMSLPEGMNALFTQQPFHAARTKKTANSTKESAVEGIAV